jgi:malonate decarboxylase delta subunit
MALHTLELDLAPCAGTKTICASLHTGVTGSSDLEILMQPEPLGGRVAVKIVTPVTGFDALWTRVMTKFLDESGLYDTRIEINDNNATPAVVLLRLQQALSLATTTD